jgi:hypothetical protein
MTAIRATMIDADRCEAEGHSVKAAAPVLALCRKLIEAGYDPATPLHAYRGDVLALRVRSIGEGAKLTVTDSRCGTPVLRPWRDQQAGSANPTAHRIDAATQRTPRPDELPVENKSALRGSSARAK